MGKKAYKLDKIISVLLSPLKNKKSVEIGITHPDYILAITSFTKETIVSMTDWFIYLIAGVSLPITENLIPRGIL